MNPYASFLGDLDPRVVIAATPARIAAQAGRLGTDGLRRSPAPGKWSAAEVICHLADCEVAFAFRIRQTLAEDNHVCQPFDQDLWAKPYAQLDPSLALEQFVAARRWNVALLETIPPAGLAKKLRHPERGEMTLETVVQTMAGHDLNHLAQLERIA
jgi:hypothetical protein